VSEAEEMSAEAISAELGRLFKQFQFPRRRGRPRGRNLKRDARIAQLISEMRFRDGVKLEAAAQLAAERFNVSEKTCKRAYDYYWQAVRDELLENSWDIAREDELLSHEEIEEAKRTRDFRPLLRKDARPK
jgi:hypothetical protein